MELRPPPARLRGPDNLPPRPVELAELELLDGGEPWAPGEILARFGPAANEREYLPRLLIAAAVVGGPHRLQELADRILQLDAPLEPRIQGLLTEAGLALRTDTLRTVALGLAAARIELPQTRARATNSAVTKEPHPFGLRFLDLRILLTQLETTVLAYELSNRRNVAGVDYARAMAGRRPELRFAEAWLERIFGSARLAGVLLFLPPGYGRVVLVHDDGRLAYDPGADPEDHR